MDRNLLRKITITVDEGSLSARRAWIEISPAREPFEAPIVALRKESVDRNVYLYNFKMFACMSLSARRAWIEILSP